MISEQHLLRKVTRRLIPFMFLLYIVSYLDRVNVSYAALQMNAALGFSAEIYSFGAGIFFIGYFLFEIPSNLILHRVGARMWIARILITWGIISSAMMFVQGIASFYVLRFLLGIAEAGFFPGMILYLTYWFPAHARGRAVARFMTATAIAGAIGSPLSGFLLEMDGIGDSAAGNGFSWSKGFLLSFWDSSHSSTCPTDPKKQNGSMPRRKPGSPTRSIANERTQLRADNIPWAKRWEADACGLSPSSTSPSS